jgi:tRNA nucleotidyltransferase (CCA-adding enzyme)
MKVYLVGGAVRDMLRGREVADRDYVVVGSTVEDMTAQGFEKVGADFPVFLHPDTFEEYALARRESKTGVGYLGFTSEFGVDVTLEEDLARRDLTVNSMAFEPEEHDPESFLVHDYFGGQDDLQAKVLRHTSDAFAEDPVRVLRMARLRARFGPEWTVAPETVALVSQMAKRGVLSELTAERVWKELSRALMEPHARLFFDTLLEVDALHVVFPEVYKLKTALEARRWHPEGDAYEHTMLVLTQAVEFGYNLETRFAALVHDFGKGLTPRAALPKHYGHEMTGVAVAESFANRLTVPSKMRDRAKKTTRYHMHMHKLDTLNPKTFIKMFEDMGAFNDPTVVELLVRVGECDERGRLGSEDNEVAHLQKLKEVFDCVNAVRFDDVFPRGETNVNKIKDGMYRARVHAAAKRITKERTNGQ